LRLRSFTLALLALGIHAGAHAGVFDGDALRENAELRRQVEKQNQEFEARFSKLDEAIRNIGVIQLLQQIEGLNTELAKLRGQIEVLNNQNEQVQKRQRDFYLDLDTRLRRLEGNAAPAPAAETGALAAPASGVTAAASAVRAGPASKDKDGGELRAYDGASNLFKKGEYAQAVEAFNAFMHDFPASPLVANAQYWIGMSHFNLRDYKNAQGSQEALIKLYPESPKVPDALLAIASIQNEQGDAGSARNTLEDIIARYPGTEAAAKARTRLTPPRR
jgi:tol-pal system protein YbgF